MRSVAGHVLREGLTNGCKPGDQAELVLVLHLSVTFGVALGTFDGHERVGSLCILSTITP